MQIERKIQVINGVFMVSIPIDLARWLNLNNDSILILQDEEGKKGRYLSVWQKNK